MSKRAPEPADNGSLAKATVHGVLWIVAGRFLKAPTNLITIAILARLLTPADFGVVAIGIVVMGLATVMVDGTFGMVLVQKRTIDPPLIGASLLLSAGLAGIFSLALLLSGSTVERYFDFPELSGVLHLLAAVLPISAAMAVTSALLQRSSRFGVLSINSFVAQVVNGVVAISLALAGMGLWSLVWGQVAQVCTETLLGFRAVRPHYRFGFTMPALRDALHSGGMFTVSKLFGWAAGNVDLIIVGRLLGAAPLGLYSRAISLLMTLNQLAGTGTARVLFSSFARMQDDRQRMQRALNRALSTSLVVTSLASAFVILLADLIVQVLLGDQWLAAIPIVQVLFAGFVARSGYIVAEAVPLALGLGRANAARQGIQFVLVAAGTAIGSQFGPVGAAAGVALAYWLFYLLSLGFVTRLLDLKAASLLRVHLNAVAVIAIPVLATVGARLLLDMGPGLVANFAAAIVFCIAAALVLTFAPASLLSRDIVDFREHFFRLVSQRVRSGNARAPR